MSEANPLCPVCGDLLDAGGWCFGENPDYPHGAAMWDLDKAPQLELPLTDEREPVRLDGGYPGLVTLDGDMITRPWRYK